MNTRGRLLLSAACALAFITPHANAQSIEELKAEIEALKAGVAALEAKLEGQQEQLDAEQVQIDEGLDLLTARTDALARMGTAEAPREGMVVGNTVVKVGGIVDLDVNVTDTSDGEIAGPSIARDFYIPSATPIGGLGEDTPDTDFTAEATRFFLTTATDAGERKIGSRVELDFLGSGQGNELVSNSYSPRIRHAFVTVDNWLFGQTWSTFQNTTSIPESASFLALSDGMVFVRQAQVRYTAGPWQFALENPNTREFFAGARDDGFIPDMVAKYTAKGEWGNVSLAALGRQLVDERPAVSQADIDEETAFGWGVSVAGNVNLSPDTDVKFSLTGGEGVGRYIGLAAIADARFDQDGELEPISSVGGLVALRHRWSDTTRTTVGYSGLFADAELGETESVQSVLAVFAHDIAPRTTIAAEVLYGQRTIEAAPGLDDSGDIMRVTFSTKYSF